MCVSYCHFKSWFFWDDSRMRKNFRKYCSFYRFSIAWWQSYPTKSALETAICVAKYSKMAVEMTHSWFPTVVAKTNSSLARETWRGIRVSVSWHNSLPNPCGLRFATSLPRLLPICRYQGWYQGCYQSYYQGLLPATVTKVSHGFYRTCVLWC